MAAQPTALHRNIAAMFPPGTQKIPRMRVFLDFLIEHFEQERWPHEKRRKRRPHKA
jgi:hypothetical protein